MALFYSVGEMAGILGMTEKGLFTDLRARYQVTLKLAEEFITTAKHFITKH